MTSSLQSNPAEIWAIAKNELQKVLTPDVYKAFFKEIRFESFKGNTFFLIAGNPLSQFFVADNYSKDVIRALELASGESNLNFTFCTAQEENSSESASNALEHAPFSAGGHSSVPASSLLHSSPSYSPKRNSEEAKLDPAINRQNTFESFIQGSENEMALAASLGISSNIADPNGINPLFIFGSSGLGKTHLMHAIANRVFSNRPDARICYVTCESFTNDFLTAMSQNKLPDFRRRYRDLHLLLVDDIQFLAGKEKTQEEFFHTFNQLCINGCKIVLTSDRPANDIKIEDRLISRFQQGISADIKSPCLETRLAILKKKAELRNFDFSVFPGILEFVAQHITRNVRNLEGAVNTLSSYVLLRNSKSLSFSEVEGILSSYLRQEEAVKITPELIQRYVAEFYKIDVQKLIAQGRVAKIAFARQVAMYLCSELTDLKLTDIGAAFGGRDHGTVIHAKKTVKNRIDTDAGDKRDIELLRARISGERN